MSVDVTISVDLISDGLVDFGLSVFIVLSGRSARGTGLSVLALFVLFVLATLIELVSLIVRLWIPRDRNSCSRFSLSISSCCFASTAIGSSDRASSLFLLV